METIIIVAIISLTLIALVSCYINYIRIKYGQEHNPISYIFWGSISISVAVIIYSHYFCGNERVLDFFSLASAIISIILAIITIVYSFYTNSRSNGQIELLNNAARDVQKASRTYSESAEALEINISKIINAINRVEAKTDKILIQSLSESSSKSNVIDTDEKHAKFDIRNYIKTFIAISSPLGILSMYACVLSHDKSIPFHLSLVSDSDGVMYCAGFLIATTGTGIVNSSIDFSTGMVTVNDYVNIVKDDILEWLEKNPLQKPLDELKNRIDNYFK